jgi:hypothetical protein
MGALERFLDQDTDGLDIASLMARDVQEMESAVPPPSLYKYLSDSRTEFFEKPAIRFTQRTSLNDPFELTKRWSEFTSSPVRNAFGDIIRAKMERITANKGLVLEMIKEEFAKKGVFLSAEQMAEASRILLSPAGDQLYRDIVKNAFEQVAPFTELSFDVINAGAEHAFEDTTSKLGIFSVSETPVNEQMWGLYSNSGSGFVVEFDAHNHFFIAPNGRNLFRKVKYTNQRVRDFWENPLYLFMVKNENWLFEREWRMLKQLTDCDETKVHGSDNIHLWCVMPGMIKSVIFGYNYDQQKLAEHGARIQAYFDPSIHIQWAVANRSSGEIELKRLL